MENLRVYVIILENYKGNWFIQQLSTDEFIAEAERQGNVYSILGFQEAFNNDEINMDDSFIRIL